MGETEDAPPAYNYPGYENLSTASAPPLAAETHVSFCVKCGHKFNKEAAFCPKCGVPHQAAATALVQQVPVPVQQAILVQPGYTPTPTPLSTTNVVPRAMGNQDQHKLYCGRILVNTPGSHLVRCGPMDGDNCQDCKEAQARGETRTRNAAGRVVRWGLGKYQLLFYCGHYFGTSVIPGLSDGWCGGRTLEHLGRKAAYARGPNCNDCKSIQPELQPELGLNFVPYHQRPMFCYSFCFVFLVILAAICLSTIP